MLRVEVIGQARLLRKGLTVETLGSQVLPLARPLTKLREGKTFGAVGGLFLSAQDSRQLVVELHQALTVSHPLSRRIPPARILRADFVTASVVCEGFGEPSDL